MYDTCTVDNLFVALYICKFSLKSTTISIPTLFIDSVSSHTLSTFQIKLQLSDDLANKEFSAWVGNTNKITIKRFALALHS